MSATAHATSPDDAKQFVDAALRAMGGDQKIRDLVGMHLEGSVVRNELVISASLWE